MMTKLVPSSSAAVVLPMFLMLLSSVSTVSTATTATDRQEGSSSSTTVTKPNSWIKHSLTESRRQNKKHQQGLRVKGVPHKRILARRREETQRDRRRQLQSGKAKSGKKSYSFDDEVALESCYEFADRNEENGIEFGTECECLHSDRGVVANCLDDCLYCNDFNTTCGVRAAQALFTEEGDITAIGGVFEYLVGEQDEVIAVERFECTVDDDNFVQTCEECAVYVDGDECNSCVFEDCGNGIMAENIDCENIEIGATFDLCEDISLDVGDTFEVFNTDEFEECIDPDDISISRSGKKGKGGKKSGSSSSSGSKKSSRYYYDELPEPEDALFLDSIKSGKRKATSRRKLENERKIIKGRVHKI